MAIKHKQTPIYIICGISRSYSYMTSPESIKAVKVIINFIYFHELDKDRVKTYTCTVDSKMHNNRTIQFLIETGK